MNDEELDRHARAIAAQLEQEHPDLETELFVYAEGGLSSDHRLEIARHLEECARCREDVGDAGALTPGRARPKLLWMPLTAAAAAAVIALLFVTRDDTVTPTATPSAPPASVSTPAATLPAPPPPEPARFARAEWETLVRDARAGTSPALPDLSSLRGESYVLRGTNAGAAELAPAGVVVETTRPELRWPAPKNARSVVTIYARDEEVARSEELSTNRWKPERDLRRGVTYTWQAELHVGDDIAIVPEPPAPPARFRVLDAAAAAELEEAKRTHDDPFLLGLLYAKAGLFEDARETLSGVTASEDTTASQRILQQLPP